MKTFDEFMTEVDESATWFGNISNFSDSQTQYLQSSIARIVKNVPDAKVIIKQPGQDLPGIDSADNNTTMVVHGTIDSSYFKKLDAAFKRAKKK